MLTINYGVFTTSFSEQTEKARQGHALRVTRHNGASFIVAHPTILTETERKECKLVTATDMFSNISIHCKEVAEDCQKLIVTSHGLARCCILSESFADRANTVR